MIKKSNKLSIISENMSITGDIYSDSDLHLDGILKGNIQCKHLHIGPKGQLEGSITSEEVDISGTMIGQVKALKVILRKSSRVEGDIMQDCLTIETGAQLIGNCQKRDSEVDIVDLQDFQASA